MNTVPRLCQRKQNRGVSDNVNHLVAGEVGHLAVDPGGLAQGHRHHAAVGARVQEVGAGRRGGGRGGGARGRLGPRARELQPEVALEAGVVNVAWTVEWR